MSKRLGGIIGRKYKKSSWHLIVMLSGWLCMAINNNVELSVQYNGGLLPDILLFTQGYYDHRRIRLNAM